MSHEAVFYWFCGVMAVGFILISTVGGYGSILAALSVAGFGMGAVISNYGVWVIGLAPPAIRGRVIGGLSAATSLGRFFSPVIPEPAV